MSIYNRAAPEKPFHIYNSPLKIVTSTCMLLLGMALLGYCMVGPAYVTFFRKYKDINIETLATLNGLALIGAVLTCSTLVLWPIFVAIKKFISLSKPVVIIARQGIQFRGYPPVHWNNIKENTFRSEYINGLPSRKVIIIQTKDNKKKKEYSARTLKITADEYLKQCDIYSDVSA